MLLQFLIQNLTMEKDLNQSLILVSISSITNQEKYKFNNLLLNAYVTTPNTSNKVAILSKECNLYGDKWAVNQEALAVCKKNDNFRLQLYDEGKLSAFMNFPLQQMLEMPRVTHQIQCKLLKNQQWKTNSQPLKHIAKVNLSIFPFNKDLGKFIISFVEIELTRNTELIGQMDPYVEFGLQDQLKKTDIRDNEGMHCIWSQKIEFNIQNISKGFVLSVRVLDKDNLSSDLVGSVDINLVTQKMLLANEQVRSKSFTLLYGGQSAGKIKLGFQFLPKQFSF